VFTVRWRTRRYTKYCPMWTSHVPEDRSNLEWSEDETTTDVNRSDEDDDDDDAGESPGL